MSFAYNSSDDAEKALNNISLKIYEGERVLILGHNGSGKSTLAKIMGALQSPLQGVCLMSGRDVNEIPFDELRADIGMVFQNPDNQIVASIVDDDVAFAPENQGLNSEEIQRRVSAAINTVGLSKKAGALTSAMSGGEKQRMALAGAIAADVKCLILDEPTAMLDPEGRIQVEDTIRKIHKSGVTIIQITHQLEFFDEKFEKIEKSEIDEKFEKIAEIPENKSAGKNKIDDVDRILVLSHGELIWEGTPEDFMPVSERMGFERPERPVSINELKEILKNNSASQPPAAKFKALEGFEKAEKAEKFEKVEGLAEPEGLESFAECEGRELKNKNFENKKFIGIRNLYFRFANSERDILHDICADIHHGEWLSITGHTGSGKSTLVQHLNALYKIQAGEILINGENLPQEGEEVHALRKRIGLVFQNPEDQLFCPTVREELSFAPANAGFSGEKLNQAVLNAIKLVGLDEKFLSRNPLALSGGERRLIAIASVLAAEPECVVLDEPLAGLDNYYKNHVLEMLFKLKNQGKCIVIITHDINSALKFSDKIIIMERGKRVDGGAAKNFNKNNEFNENKDKKLKKLRPALQSFSILGQYVPTNSVIHRLDPRAKLISILILVSSVFSAGTPQSLAFCAVVLLFLVRIARLSIKTVLKSARPVFFLAAFTFLFNLSTLFWENITPLDACLNGAFLAARLLILMLFAVLLPLTTTPLELSDGIGAMLQPLEIFKFPAQESAIMIGMALRFIPLLMEETDKITRAQLSRGARLDQGGIFKRLISFFPVLIPLFIIIFRRADEMALAMEARGYNIGRKRTRRKPLKWKFSDTFALMFCSVLAAAFFVL